MLRTHRTPNPPTGTTTADETHAHPIAAATSAVAVALAQAHEAGDAAAVRILHAVLALLSATPQSNAH